MTYADSSVYLRILVGHPGAAGSAPGEAMCTSAITRTEGRRMLYRLHSKSKLDDASLDEKLRELDALLAGVAVIPCDDAVLERASHPMRSPIGSLDAIHLASALAVGASRLMTHNVELAIAARAAGLEPLLTQVSKP